jgi:hypothetical protein
MSCCWNAGSSEKTTLNRWLATNFTTNHVSNFRSIRVEKDKINRNRKLLFNISMSRWYILYNSLLCLSLLLKRISVLIWYVTNLWTTFTNRDRFTCCISESLRMKWSFLSTTITTNSTFSTELIAECLRWINQSIKKTLKRYSLWIRTFNLNYISTSQIEQKGNEGLTSNGAAVAWIR